ncbi:hypothetical protein SYNPS1DRAFT_27222 [Syncephalis pseudoplumigaleata]|uniref:SAP domain-containing protein n=1 Tax=Syncephalis pseudoplumigaleata TaxID=1712513 RepID=A0A4P9Z3R9_9FUNG|nr:hypothetical protein SYNPS1DRAFT_27222 [Syncephalis pseudoplumigaleata]|eukprot:RKP27116.1 hypothetical protein SYNPS1DRAFT_27222 [Syncephalis pseudoplumigaleata]
MDTTTALVPAQLKVVELREALSARQLSIKGKKAELVARLEEALAQEHQARSTAAESTSSPPPDQPEATTPPSTAMDTSTQAEEDDAASTEPTSQLPVTTAAPTVDEEARDQEGDAARDSLCVWHFVRPFTLPQAKELFEQYGAVERFWMDKLRSRCYVTFALAKDAATAAEGIDGLLFPEPHGKRLEAVLLTQSRASELLEREQAAVASADVARRLEPQLQDDGSIELVDVGPVSTMTKRARHEPRGHADAAEEYRRKRSMPGTAAAVSPPVPPPRVDIDALFCKTTTKPHLYYQPLNDEQVEAKRMARRPLNG